MRIGRWVLAIVVVCGVGASGSLNAQLLSHWELDGDLLDAAGVNDGIYHGGPEPIFVAGYDGTPNGAVYLDGVDDSIEIPDDPGLPTLALTDNFTLALWFKAASTEQSEKYLLSRNGGGGQYAIIYEYLEDTIEFFAPSRVDPQDELNNPRPFSAMTVADTKWHHIAYTYDGQFFVGYLDGAEVFFSEISFSLSDLFFAPWYIGAANPNANHVNGAIDDVRIYGEALDDGAIEDLYSEPVEPECPADGDTHCGGLDVEGPADGGPGTYTATATATDDSGDDILYTFRADNGLGTVLTVGPQTGATAEFGLTEGSWTVSVAVDDDAFCQDVAADAECTGEIVDVVSVPKLLSHWELDGDLLDAAGANDGIFFGDVEPVYVDGWDGTADGAILLDGLDDYVQIPPAQDLALSDNFTLALWFRAETTDQIEKYLLSRNDSIPGGSGKQYAIIYEYAEDQVDFYAPARLFGDDPRAGGVSLMPLADTDWHHIAYTYDGVTWSGYIDGVQILSIPLSFSLDDTFASSWWIGAANPNANWTNGSFDDVRIYNYALSGGEVLELAGGEDTCPEEGDTHATDLAVDGPLEGGDPGTPGTYEVSADGADDSGDTVLFTFRAQPLAGAPITVGPQESDLAEFYLGEGTWTISVTVDDDPLCADKADDATLSTEIVVASVPTLVAHWLLDGDLLDDVGIHDGLFYGDLAPLFVDGVDGSPEGALSTDGIDDLVEIPHSPDLALTSSFTLALWFRAETTDQLQKYLLSRNAPGTQYAIIYEYIEDTVEFFAGGSFVGTDPRPGSGMVIPDTDWHHIAYSYDGTTLSGYLDGTRLVANDIQFTLTVFDSSWFIGAANPTANFVAGAFDDVRIYNYGLTEAEIQDIVDAEPPDDVKFRRGDANADGTLNITDGIFVLNYLFLGGDSPPCLEAADANDDGQHNITDGIYVLNFLFLGGEDPPAPGPTACGTDPETNPANTFPCATYNPALCQ